MQGTSFADLAPRSSSIEFVEEIDNIQEEISFQSKNLQDSQLSQEKKITTDKKYNFNPMIWTSEDEINLIQLHKKIGNRWTQLSKHFPGSCQNFIKNHFYSRLRKSIRKLNKSISTLFGKKYNKFNLNIIFKLSNISEGKVIGKCNVENQITNFYKDFIYKLIQFSQMDDDFSNFCQDQLKFQVESFTLSLIALQNLFRIISGERVYKGKKKNIAYLKRFNFKLDPQSKKVLVISKENCHISDGPIEIQLLGIRSSESISQYIVEEIEQSQLCDKRKEISEILDQANNEKESKLNKQCKGHEIKQCLENTDESHFSSSISFFTVFDEQLRQFQLTNDCGLFSQNLLDKYSGTKFNFDLEL